MRYLTIVPVPGRGAHGLAALGRAAPWFPVVGLALGAVLVGVERLTGAVFSPLLAALLTVTVWTVLSGGLHLDGLADCLDGLAGRDAAHRPGAGRRARRRGAGRCRAGPRRALGRRGAGARSLHGGKARGGHGRRARRGDRDRGARWAPRDGGVGARETLIYLLRHGEVVLA